MIGRPTASVPDPDSATPSREAPNAPSHIQVTPPIHYVGTPVMLLCTENENGTPNLAPASSFWALGNVLVIGLETAGQTARNLHDRPDLTVNFPSPELWPSVEAIADVTGMDPVPAPKAANYRFAPDKFTLAGLTPQESQQVRPPRVEECALQLEGAVRRLTLGVNDTYLMAEVEVVAVHAHSGIVIAGTNHIDPRAWRPTIYSYRHYFGLGKDHGHRRQAAAVQLVSQAIVT